jgi:hypothetical protein
VDYYSAGLCGRCHRFAPQRVDGCLDCYAWGVIRRDSWLCQGCRGWRRRYRTKAACVTCGRSLHLNPAGVCRLCRRQGAMVRPRRGRLDVVAANHYGQQLFLADMFRHRPARPRPSPPRPAARPRQLQPVTARQVVLFDLPHDLAARRASGFPTPPDPALAAFLDHAARDHAARHGWSITSTAEARRAIHILLGLQDTPGAPIAASEATQVARIGLAVQPVLDVLAAAGMLHDDRTPPITDWFSRQLVGLPEPMAAEVRTWFDVLHNGSAIPPRSRPRSPITIRVRLCWVLPTLHTWAAAGHKSLREISREQVLAALPRQGTPRATLGQGLRSLFATLKAHRVIFTNPTARVRTGKPQTRPPLPLDPAVLREAVHDPQPPRAALAALVAFHGPRNGQLRDLRLTDVRDGRLHLGDRTILLATPVRQRLAAYLDYRTTRWPNTTNPHLFINLRTAVRDGRVSHHWINQTIGIPVQAIREDRILHEAHATGGDIRHLCDLFGLSVPGAQRYTTTLDHPDLCDLGNHHSQDPGSNSPAPASTP